MEGVVGVLGHEHGALGSFDVLLDERGAVSGHDLSCLPPQAGRCDHTGCATQVDTGVAAVVFHEEREAKPACRTFDVGLLPGHHMRRRGDAQFPAHAFHRCPRWLVEHRRRTGEGHAESLERPDDLDSGRFFVGRSVAEIEEEIEALAHERGHGPDGRRLFQDGKMPLRVGEEGTGIAGPVVVRERIGVEILVRQQTDAHANALGLGKAAEST